MAAKASLLEDKPDETEPAQPEEQQKEEEDIKKKPISKWSHDLFDAGKQTPKSKDELSFTYGYDIREEDDAPKPRRRRKYGRGPNKYTRNWKDEDAYAGGVSSKPNDRKTKKSDSVLPKKKEKVDTLNTAPVSSSNTSAPTVSALSASNPTNIITTTSTSNGTNTTSSTTTITTSKSEQRGEKPKIDKLRAKPEKHVFKPDEGKSKFSKGGSEDSARRGRYEDKLRNKPDIGNKRKEFDSIFMRRDELDKRRPAGSTKLREDDRKRESVKSAKPIKKFDEPKLEIFKQEKLSKSSLSKEEFPELPQSEKPKEADKKIDEKPLWGKSKEESTKSHELPADCDVDEPPPIVRTQTFENSKYVSKRFGNLSNPNYQFDTKGKPRASAESRGTSNYQYIDNRVNRRISYEYGKNRYEYKDARNGNRYNNRFSDDSRPYHNKQNSYDYSAENSNHMYTHRKNESKPSFGNLEVSEEPPKHSKRYSSLRQQAAGSVSSSSPSSSAHPTEALSQSPTANSVSSGSIQLAGSNKETFGVRSNASTPPSAPSPAHSAPSVSSSVSATTVPTSQPASTISTSVTSSTSVVSQTSVQLITSQPSITPVPSMIHQPSLATVGVPTLSTPVIYGQSLPTTHMAVPSAISGQSTAAPAHLAAHHQMAPSAPPTMHQSIARAQHNYYDASRANAYYADTQRANYAYMGATTGAPTGDDAQLGRYMTHQMGYTTGAPIAQQAQADAYLQTYMHPHAAAHANAYAGYHAATGYSYAAGQAYHPQAMVAAQVQGAPLTTAQAADYGRGGVAYYNMNVPYVSNVGRQMSQRKRQHNTQPIITTDVQQLQQQYI